MASPFSDQAFWAIGLETASPAAGAESSFWTSCLMAVIASGPFFT
jgi:hypothetical protein